MVKIKKKAFGMSQTATEQTLFFFIIQSDFFMKEEAKNTNFVIGQLIIFAVKNKKIEDTNVSPIMQQNYSTM